MTGRAGIDHVSFGVADAERSRAFYESALRPLDIAHVMSVPGDAGGAGAWHGFGRAGAAFFWVGEGATIVRTHIAFAARTRAEVDAFHAAALSAGGRDNGAPGLRAHYDANYYAAFVFDPDGNNVEAVCRSAP